MKLADVKILYKILACLSLLVAVVGGAVWQWRTVAASQLRSRLADFRRPQAL